MPDADVTEDSTGETPTELADTAPDETPEAETFDRPYVEKIRRESAGYRDKAKTAEIRAAELGRALFAARVAASGKLADPTDIAFDADLLDDPEALAAAIDSLLDGKPHLKARRPIGSVGQGIKGEPTPEFSLLDRLKGNS